MLGWLVLGLCVMTANAERSLPPAYEIGGLWHGQFPANEGDEGIDIDFQQNQAYFVLDGRRVQTQELRFEQEGDSLSIWLTSLSDAEDQALFTGKFVDPNTIRGRYGNKLRAEDFAMDLVKRP